MKIEGFREKLVKRTERELKLNPNFSLPEATATAAIEVLHGIGGELEVRMAKGLEVDREVIIEIERRANLVHSSPAAGRAAQKEVDRLNKELIIWQNN